MPPSVRTRRADRTTAQLVASVRALRGASHSSRVAVLCVIGFGLSALRVAIFITPFITVWNALCMVLLAEHFDRERRQPARRDGTGHD